MGAGDSKPPCPDQDIIELAAKLADKSKGPALYFQLLPADLLQQVIRYRAASLPTTARIFMRPSTLYSMPRRRGPITLSDLELAIGAMPGLWKRPFRSTETVDRLLTVYTLPLDDDVLCYANLVGSATVAEGVASVLSVCFFTHFGVYFTQLNAQKEVYGAQYIDYHHLCELDVSQSDADIQVGPHKLRGLAHPNELLTWLVKLKDALLSWPLSESEKALKDSAITDIEMILNEIAPFKEPRMHFYPAVPHKSLVEALRWNRDALEVGEVPLVVLDNTENPSGGHTWMVITTHRIISTDLRPSVSFAELINDRTKVALMRYMICFRIDGKVRLDVVGLGSHARAVLGLLQKMQELLRKRFHAEPERVCLAPLQPKVT